MFFSFDGVDGVGKSTQVQHFCQWLRQQGHDVVACRDPGSTELGEALRQILLQRHEMPMHHRSEMLVYMAARAQLVEQVIRPALDAGRTVVTDRFLLANVVYQAHAGGLCPEQVWRVGQIATAGLCPDLIFVLDMDVGQAGKRIDRPPDRMEARGLDYLQRVRTGYLEEVDKQVQPMVLIDAAGDVDAVATAIRDAARQVLDNAGD